MRAMKVRFGPLVYEDPMAKIKKLRQTGSLHDYLKVFDSLLDKAQLGEEQALSCFLAGLKHDMEMNVRMFNLKTLQDAYSLAKLQEAVGNEPVMYGQGVVNKYTVGLKGIHIFLRLRSLMLLEVVKMGKK